MADSLFNNSDEEIEEIEVIDFTEFGNSDEEIEVIDFTEFDSFNEEIEVIDFTKHNKIMNNILTNVNIDAFYQFNKKPNTKTSFPCTRSTGNYLPFENGRNAKGKLTAYFSDGDYTTENGRRKERWKLSMKSKHVSKLKTFADHTTKATGDIKGTNDLLLFVVNNSLEDFTEVSVFVAKGKKYDYAFVTAFLEGEFFFEMKQMGDNSEPE